METDGRPLYRQLAEALRREIQLGLLRPGERLPAELELVERRRVSRTTVRLALAELERAGLIERHAGRGTFVRPPEIREDVLSLASCSEELAAQGFEPGVRVVGLTRISAEPAIAQRLELPAGSAVVEISRLRLADGQPICLDVTYLPEAIGRTLSADELGRERICWLLQRKLSLPLVERRLSVRAVAAGESTAAHLDVPAGFPLLVVEIVAYTGSGRPVEFQRREYRGDRLHYDLELVDVQATFEPPAAARVTKLARIFR